MNYRINTKIIAIFILLCVLVGAFFMYSLFSNKSTPEVLIEDQVATSTQAEEMVVTAKHQFLDGMHTIAGKTEVPTPCHRLITEPYFKKGEPVSVEVRFNTLLEGEACPSQVHEVPFRVTFEAPENILITGTWNGSPLRLNLIPLQPGEVIEDELFIKG